MIGEMDAEIAGYLGTETEFVQTQFFIDRSAGLPEPVACICQFLYDVSTDDYRCAIYYPTGSQQQYAEHIVANTASLKVDITVVGADTVIDFYINDVLKHSGTRVGYQAALSKFEILTEGDSGTGADGRQLRTRWGDYEWLWDSSSELDQWISVVGIAEVKDGYFHSAVVGARTIYQFNLPGGGDILQAEPGAPIWAYRVGTGVLFEQIISESGQPLETILIAAVANPSAWLQPGGRRYVAFDLDGDCQYVYYDEDTWSDAMAIREDMTDPAALMLEPSRDVFIVCLSGNDLKLNILRWDGATETYSVETEIDMGATANSTGGMWQTAGGIVYLAFTDTDDAIQTISSNLSGQTWA